MVWESIEGHDWAVLTTFELDVSPRPLQVNIVSTSRSERSIIQMARVLDVLENAATPSALDFWQYSSQLGLERPVETMDDDRPKGRSAGVRSAAEPEPVAFFGYNVELAAAAFCEIVFADRGLDIDSQFLPSYILGAVPVPTFGSTPKGLSSISTQLITSAGALALITNGGQELNPGRLIIAGAVQRFWIYFGRPTATVTSVA